MKTLILNNGPIRAANEAGTLDVVLSLLNEPTEKLVTSLSGGEPGFVSNASMARELGEAAVASFLSAAVAAIAVNRGFATVAGDATAELIDSFKSRFVNSADGIDFSNEAMRSQILAILTSPYLPAVIDPAPFLDLGYKMVGKAFVEYGQDATADDVLSASLEIIQDAYTPNAGDVTSYRLLLNANMSSDGRLGVSVRATPEIFREGVLVHRGDSISFVGSPADAAGQSLTDAIEVAIQNYRESITNG